MSIQIGDVSKQGKTYINKQIIIMIGARSLGCGVPWTSSIIIIKSEKKCLPILKEFR